MNLKNFQIRIKEFNETFQQKFKLLKHGANFTLQNGENVLIFQSRLTVAYNYFNGYADGARAHTHDAKTTIQDFHRLSIIYDSAEAITNHFEMIKRIPKNLNEEELKEFEDQVAEIIETFLDKYTTTQRGWILKPEYILNEAQREAIKPYKERISQFCEHSPKDRREIELLFYRVFFKSLPAMNEILEKMPTKWPTSPKRIKEFEKKAFILLWLNSFQDEAFLSHEEMTKRLFMYIENKSEAYLLFLKRIFTEQK